MRREQVTVVRQGRRYRLGRTEAYGGIWRKRPWGWRLVARYPLNDEGRRIAEGQFSLWEPEAGFGPEADPAISASGSSGAMPLDGTVVRGPHRHLGAAGWAAAALAVLVLAGAGALTDHLVSEKVTSTASKTVGSKTSGSGSTTTTYTRPPVGGGWLAQGSSWVIFIQWSSTRGSFSGTAQDVTLGGSPPTLKLTTTSVPVSGTLQGSRVTLTFEGRAEQFGTIATGRFTVNFPQSNGTLAPVTFVATSTDRYNQVIDALRSRVTSANVSAQEAAAKAKAETSINHAATAVLSGIGGLSTEETQLAKDVAAVNGPLGTAAKDLAATQNALSIVNSCLDANTVHYDANTVHYDANDVGYDVNTVKRDITAIQGDISTLETASAALQAKEKALPGYTPPDQPAATAVTKAVAAAQAAIAAAVTTTNNYIAQVNSDVSVAFATATQAYRSAGCGTAGVTNPTPIPSITS